MRVSLCTRMVCSAGRVRLYELQWEDVLEGREVVQGWWVGTAAGMRLLWMPFSLVVVLEIKEVLYHRTKTPSLFNKLAF